LGGYVGYSMIAFAAALREAGGRVYHSLEKNPGLGDVVEVVVGSSSTSLKPLHANGILKSIDLMFISYYKPL
jgi:catechol O-methyltransferase